MMQYLPWLLAGIIGTALVFSLYYNLKFAKIILQMEDDIGECLDILDEKYKALSKILEIPIFFDSPQVRKVIEDIKSARGSILYIANRLSNFDQEDNIDAKSKENN